MGWGIEGHKVIGKIATEFLTDRSRQEIAVLLESDLDAKGQPSRRKTLSELSQSSGPEFSMNTGSVCFVNQHPIKTIAISLRQLLYGALDNGYRPNKAGTPTATS
jgi:hypothetical protein